MKGIPQGRYTKEFRQEVVKLVMEEKLSWSEAALRLSLPTSTLGNWVKAYKSGKLVDIGKTYRPLTEIEMDLLVPIIVRVKPGRRRNWWKSGWSGIS